jgi:hypothetical protein
MYEDYESPEEEAISFINPNHSIRMNQLGVLLVKIELEDIEMSKIEQ